MDEKEHVESFLVGALHSCPKIVKCSLNDYFVFRAPVSVVFFYKETIDQCRIINALKRTLNDFPIFAGVLVKHSGHMYIDCNNQGVQVTVVQKRGFLFKPLPDLKNLEKFVDAIQPYKALAKAAPLLKIKITYYDDGMVIGYSWHHSLGDMATFMEFLKALSSSAQGKAYQQPLIPGDRTRYFEALLKERSYLQNHQKKPSKMKFLSIMDILRLARQALSAKGSVLLHFTDEELQRLRSEMSRKAGQKLSRNDVLCAYLLDCLNGCQENKRGVHHLSLVVNMRTKMGMPSNLLGNYVDLISVKIDEPGKVDRSASEINKAVKNYLVEHFQHEETEEFVYNNGGVKKIGRIIPEKLLPQHKNLMLTNWSNFGVYSIDFGIRAPRLFLPTGRSPIPSVGCIVEGFDNKGLLVSLALPSRIAKYLARADVLEQIHKFR